MGKRSRLKAQRRQERIQQSALPPCSYEFCGKGRPAGTHVFMLKDGKFYTSCDECVEPMMHVLKLKGIDAQVVTKAALKLLQRAKSPHIKTAQNSDTTVPPLPAAGD